MNIDSDRDFARELDEARKALDRIRGAGHLPGSDRHSGGIQADFDPPYSSFPKLPKTKKRDGIRKREFSK